MNLSHEIEILKFWAHIIEKCILLHLCIVQRRACINRKMSQICYIHAKNVTICHTFIFSFTSLRVEKFVWLNVIEFSSVAKVLQNDSCVVGICTQFCSMLNTDSIHICIMYIVVVVLVSACMRTKSCCRKFNLINIYIRVYIVAYCQTKIHIWNGEHFAALSPSSSFLCGQLWEW